MADLEILERGARAPLRRRVFAACSTRRGILLGLAAVGALLLAGWAGSAHGWIVYYKPALKGRVIGAETKEPIEGAVVVVAYRKHALRVAPEAVEYILNIRETTTDASGYFHVPSYFTIMEPLSWSARVHMIVFKAGYGPPRRGGIVPPAAFEYPLPSEDFYAGEPGQVRETWVREDARALHSKVTAQQVPFGVVELPRMKTRAEADRVIPSPFAEKPRDLKKQKALTREIERAGDYLMGRRPREQ